MNKTKFFTFVRRRRVPLITIATFLVSLAVGFAVGFLFFPTTYISEAGLTTARDIDNKQMETITSLMKMEEPIRKTHERLVDEHIFHSSGSVISEKEIRAGLSEWYLNTNAVISLYYKTTDFTIAKKVIDTHIDISIPFVEENMPHLRGSIIVASYGSMPKKVENNRYQIILGIPAVSSVLAFGLARTFTITKKNQIHRIDV